MARLSAADRQLAQITVTDRELVLTVKLPTSPAPAGRAQWRRVRLTAAIPAHLHGRAITDWHLPTLVLDRRGLLVAVRGDRTRPCSRSGIGRHGRGRGRLVPVHSRCRRHHRREP